MKHIVVFDLDGTLAEVAHRRHLVENKQWREFYAACIYDTPNIPVIRTFQAHRQSGATLYIASGRSDEVKRQTVSWLQEHDCYPDYLYMRRACDHQPDHKLKRSWLYDGSIPKEEILCVYDDRQSIVDMWRSEGLACFQVAPGQF